MKLPKIYSIYNQDLQTIEKELVSSIQANSPVLQQTSMHLLKSGGKRIRPIFVLLSAKLGTYDIEVIKFPAMALELIHSGSLVHDDVIDNSDMRRGAATIKAKWDNRIATFTGDYIFARSLELMTNIENPYAHKVLAKTMVEVSRGEIEQIKDKFNFDQSLRDYLKRIKRKTAVLIAASCQLGGIAANVSESTHKRLFLYGNYVGMSFQIIDDILDFTATEKELGKPAGSDLRQGNITLPVLFAMRDTRLKKRIMSVTEDIDQDELYTILEDIKNSGAIEKSMAMSEAYLSKALLMLDKIPANKHKKALYDIAKYIGKRKN